MGVLGGIIWTAVALIIVGLAVYVMYRVSRTSEEQRVERRAQAGMWGAGGTGAVGADGGGFVGGGEACGDGGGCGGGGCGGGGCGGGGGGC